MCCGAWARAPAPDGLQLGLEVGQPQMGPVRLRVALALALALLYEGPPAVKGAAWAWLLEGTEE